MFIRCCLELSPGLESGRPTWGCQAWWGLKSPSLGQGPTRTQNTRSKSLINDNKDKRLKPAHQRTKSNKSLSVKELSFQHLNTHLTSNYTSIHAQTEIITYTPCVWSMVYIWAYRQLWDVGASGRIKHGAPLITPDPWDLHPSEWAGPTNWLHFFFSSKC